ncbi:MAG: XRE family transcriptional regulator, partial [Bacteroidota bacterium]
MRTSKIKDSEKRAIGQRIKKLREEMLGVTQEEFAARFRGEFTRGALGNWERGEGIKLSNLKLIADKLDVNFQWLASGIGKPLVDPDALDASGLLEKQPLQKSNHPSGQKSFDGSIFNQPFSVQAGVAEDLPYRAKLEGALPEIDVQVGAGEGVLGDLIMMPGDRNGHRVTAEWLLSDEFVLQEARVSRTQSLIFPVVGDSMFPSYSSGDRVIVDLSQQQLIQDAVYVISDGHSAPQIKRLQRVFLSTPERVRIISDTPQYQNEEHLLSDVKIHGRVC